MRCENIGIFALRAICAPQSDVVLTCCQGVACGAR